MAKLEESYQTRTVDSERGPAVPSGVHVQNPAPYPAQYPAYSTQPTVPSPQYPAQSLPQYPPHAPPGGAARHYNTFPSGDNSDNVSIESGEPAPLAAQKRIVDAYILALGLGIFGGHHFYLRRYSFGALYFCTFGLLGFGWFVDLFRLPLLVNRSNETIARGKKDTQKHLDDAYVCWFPFGLLGFHHFYLGRTKWGVLYLFTFGLLGIGWLVDMFYLPTLVKKVNQSLSRPLSLPVTEVKSPNVTWVLAFCPLTGLLGIHHYYLGFYQQGLFYTFTVGNLGFGYVVDWFRAPVITRRANLNAKCGLDMHAHLDDAYLYAFPLGFMGFHHFYLRRFGWGTLYLFTFGCLGIGWLYDLFRMPCLVSDYNKMLDESAPCAASQGYCNPQAGSNPRLEDPCEDQAKVLHESTDHMNQGGSSVFATGVQPYPYYPGYPGYPGYAPYTNPPNMHPGVDMYPDGYVPPNQNGPPAAYLPGNFEAGAGNPPGYMEQDGLPSYSDAVSAGSIDSSLVSTDGAPSCPPKQ